MQQWLSGSRYSWHTRASAIWEHREQFHSLEPMEQLLRRAQTEMQLQFSGAAAFESTYSSSTAEAASRSILSSSAFSRRTWNRDSQEPWLFGSRYSFTGANAAVSAPRESLLHVLQQSCSCSLCFGKEPLCVFQ